MPVIAHPEGLAAATKPAMEIALPQLPPPAIVMVPEIGEATGTGWLPDRPDTRDFSIEHAEIAPLLKKLNLPISPKVTSGSIPPAVDLRPFCSEVRDQGSLGSCTAFAGVGLIEYYENRAFGRHIDGSPLFVYKTTRELMGLVGDTGAYLRTTMGALVLFGVPPEQYWPYNVRKQPGLSGERTFDTEPGTFVYEIADNYETVNYFCLDPFGAPVSPAALLQNLKTYLAGGLPFMFGFYVFPSYMQGDIKGSFPYPGPNERAFAGHAIVAVGYNDSLKITNLDSKKTTTGALLIRNSWGAAWGDKGYGWLPYDYVLSQFASDFWTTLGMKWVDTGKFGL